MTPVTRDTAAELPAHLRDLAEFVTASPSSYHAAEEVARRLEAVGFTRLDETVDFPSAPGGYVVVRDGAAVAWIVPTGAGALGRHEGAEARAAGPDEAGPSAAVVPVFRVLGAHTDSPGFKLKPNPATVTADGWVQAGVEVYGGPLLNSWLDRELRFAGRLALDDGTQVLAATGPVGRIPQLAIHLDREVNEGLTLKRQRHTNPVVGALAPRGEGAGEVEVDGLAARVPGDVLTALAAAAGVDPAAVRGHDVVVADAQAPGLFGLAGEFFASGRLDNLSSVHAGLVALEELAREHGGAEGAIAYEGTVAGGVAGEAAGAPVIPLLAAFDHEELGSASRSGAAGPLLEAHGLTAQVHEGLGECHYGAWTGRPLSELADEPLWRVVQDQPSRATFPDGPEHPGESIRSMADRAVAAVREIDAAVTAEHGEHAVWAAVSHGDVIKSVLADATATALDDFQRLHVDPASVSVVHYTATRPMLLRSNDTGRSALTPPRPKGDTPPAGDAPVGGGAGLGSTP